MILHDDWKLRYLVVEGRIDRIRGDVSSSPVEGTKLRTFNVDDARKIEIYAFSRSKTISAVVVPIVVFIGAAIGFTAPPPGAAPRPDGSNHQH